SGLRDARDVHDTRGTVEALAQKIEASSRNFDSSHVHRPTPTPSPVSSPAPSSGVLWPNPSELTLSTQQPPDAEPAAAQTPSAEQTATNRPVVLPRPAASATPGGPTTMEGPTFASANNSVKAATTTAPGDDALSRRLAQHVRDYPHDTAGH